MELPGGTTNLASNDTSVSLPAPPSSLLGAVIVVLSLCHAVMPTIVDEGLALVPHHSVFSPVATLPIPFIWNVLTAHVFEASFLRMLLFAPGAVLLAQKLERLWTLRSLGFLLAFASVGASIVVIFIEIIEVNQTSQERDFFRPVRGCCGLIVALSVGLRHAYPLEVLPVVPKSWGLQWRHLPISLVACAMACGLLGPTWLLPEWPFAPAALFFAWFHLRYIMWFPHANSYGDHSSDFCFANFFPTALRPVAAGVGAFTHQLACVFAPTYLRIRQPEDEADKAENSQAIMFDPSQPAAGAVLWNTSGTTSLSAASATWPPAPPATWPQSGTGVPVPGGPGSKEYDERRAKALKLLDENISSLLQPSLPAARGLPSSAELAPAILGERSDAAELPGAAEASIVHSGDIDQSEV
eukprot:TRINITY_DN42469_c0_g1_i1.p1 TRINITY_DN42469_c0_g1~~TRINITY_DN42469_c0_g1_i1.p1  ORF type:complete len:412 (-),score=57.83 TRINITY_DN42469_c0_g1_i1:151-1386(-)